MKVSLVFTVLNEATSIRTLLDSIAAQTRQPNEIVVCDGGSRDGTVSILHNEPRLNIRVIEAPGANISRGRNIAIAAASYDLIACTDAGVRLDERWLESLTEKWRVEGGVATTDLSTLHSPPSPSVTAGFFLPDPHTTFEVAMSATVLPAVEDIDPATFLPSSRSVAFTKSAWQAVGGYPEWLDYCEDLIFDLKLRERFGPFAFAPQAIARFRPRSSLRSFFKQYYQYARGDGKANLFLKRHLIRYATYLVALPALIAGLVVGSSVMKLVCAVALVIGLVVYMRAPYRRLKKLGAHLTMPETLKAIALVPVIRVAGDVAKMLGYPVGVWWRMGKRNVAQQT